MSARKDTRWTDADRAKRRYYRIVNVSPSGRRYFVVGFYANLREANKILDREFEQKNRNLELYHDRVAAGNLCGAYEVTP